MSAEGGDRAVSQEDLERIEAAILDVAPSSGSIRVAESGTEIERIVHMNALYTGPEEIMVGAKISLPATMTMSQVSTVLNLAERRVRAAVPAVRLVYLEPDVWIDPNDPAPTTSAFVLLSSD